LGEKCVGMDVNSMKPLDNLCHPISVIREAEERERMAGETSRGIVFLTPGKETVEGYGSSAGRSEQGNLLILSAMTECEEMERKDR